MEVNMDISLINSVIGTSVNKGQCYGFAAWWVSQLGGLQMMGSGYMNAYSIWKDYSWSSIGWQSGSGSPKDGWKPGDIICFNPAPDGYDEGYGHVGVVKSIASDGGITFYDQNTVKYGQVVNVNPYGTAQNSIANGLLGSISGYVRPPQNLTANNSNNTTNNNMEEEKMRFTYQITNSAGAAVSGVYYYDGTKDNGLYDIDQLTIEQKIYKEITGQELKHYVWVNSAPWYNRHRQATGQALIN
jgi:hypothetical protein